MYEEAVKAIREMERCLDNYRELRKTNPELAKEKAIVDLQRKGILDKNGNLSAPYNKIMEVEEEER